MKIPTVGGQEDYYFIERKKNKPDCNLGFYSREECFLSFSYDGLNICTRTAIFRLFAASIAIITQYAFDIYEESCIF